MCALLILHSPVIASNHPYLLLRAGNSLWVVLDGSPGYLTPGILGRLYAVLQVQIIPPVSNQLRPPLSDIPAVIQFVAKNGAKQFPVGVEGIFGLTGLARWRCYHAGKIVRFCNFSEVTADSGELVRLALVRRADVIETTGVAVHEMAHLLGATDGPHCPMYENHCASGSLISDASDAYWWYGHAGDSTPTGLVCSALNARCQNSDNVEVCKQLAALLGAGYLLTK